MGKRRKPWIRPPVRDIASSTRTAPAETVVQVYMRKVVFHPAASYTILSTFDFRLSTFDFRLSTFDFRLPSVSIFPCEKMIIAKKVSVDSPIGIAYIFPWRCEIKRPGERCRQGSPSAECDHIDPYGWLYPAPLMELTMTIPLAYTTQIGEAPDPARRRK